MRRERDEGSADVKKKAQLELDVPIDELPSISSPLPKGWASVEVGELLTKIEAGKSFTCEERPPEPGEVGVVKVSAVTWGRYQEDESKTCRQPDLVRPELFVKPGDFLFSRANTIDLVGACVIAGTVTRDVMLSDKILRFHFYEVEPEWVMWWLRSPDGLAQIRALATGNQDSMRNIGQERVRRIQIPLCSQRERGEIVQELESFMSRLDAAVAGLERVQATLKRYRASVLKAAVEGRLVPTEAELARQEGREYEPASVLLERILTERRQRWEDAELAKMTAKGKVPKDDGWKARYESPIPPGTADLPKLPEGWCWSTVDMVGDILLGRRRAPEYVGPLRPYLRVANVRDDRIEFDEIKEMPFEDSEFALYQLTTGTSW